MTNKIIFFGTAAEVAGLVRNMQEFETLGNFFKVQNEIKKTKKQKELEFVFPNQISIYQKEKE